MSHVVRLLEAAPKTIYQVSYWDPQRNRWIGVQNFAGESARVRAIALCHYLNGGGSPDRSAEGS